MNKSDDVFVHVCVYVHTSWYLSTWSGFNLFTF